MPTLTSPPPDSRIHQTLPGADFFDAYSMPLAHGGRSALAIYLQAIGRTPAWVDALMTLRNRVVARLGLKDLGTLANLDPDKAADSYQPGERIGIFTLHSVSDDEVVLGDDDKHLRVQVSLCKRGAGAQEAVIVSTVVHTRNRLGRVYMRFVAPLHRLIAPAVLRRAT